MTRRDNPNDDMIPEILRRLRALETQSPIGFSSITRGALRVASPEGLLVEGSAYVSGILRGDGTFNWSGDMNITGSQHVTGPTTFDGTLTINGNTTINGTTTQNGPYKVVGAWELNGPGKIRGDVEVLDNGKFRVGNMIIDPSDGGSVTFPGGAVVQSDSFGGVQMRVGANKVYAGPSATTMQYGSKSVTLSGSGVTMTGVPTRAASVSSGAPAGCLWMDEDSGQIYRIVAG